MIVVAATIGFAPVPAAVAAPAVSGPVGDATQLAAQTPESPDHLVARAWLRTFLDRAGTDAEVEAVVDALVGGTPGGAVVTGIALGEESVGRLVDGLYQTVLGRSAEPAGRAYWVQRLRAGLTPTARLEPVLAPLLASPEAHARGGGDAGYVDLLYEIVLARPASDADRSYWTGRLATGVRSPVVVALMSTAESRGRRVGGLFSWILERPADAGGLAYWRDRLTSTNDMRAAIAMAVGPEYIAKALGGGTPEVPEPVLTDIDCPAGLPSSARLRCVTVTVAADRADFDGATLDIFAVVIAGTASPRLPDPVVYLSGGPGGTAVTPGRVSSYLNNDRTGGRDVILFDQRGTGRSGPDLTCQEVTDGTFDLLQTPTPRHEVAFAAAEAAFSACHDRLVGNGIDLSVYNTEIVADDVADIATALELEQLNLFGVSYGTTVALTTIARHPDLLRSVVLDSVLTTTSHDTAENLAWRNLRGRQAILDGCAAAPACAARYPNLAESFDEMVARYDANPHATAAVDGSGNPITIQVTGADVVAGLFQAQYDASFVPVVPFAIDQLAAGSTGLIDALASQGIDFWFGLSAGLAASVQCADRQQHTVGSDPDAVLEDHPELALFLVAAGLLSHCERWDVPSVSDAFAQPVTGDVPTFVLSGQYDPITPPEYGAEAADALDDATHVVVPNGGHGQVFATPCTTALFTAFVVDPVAGLDTSCVAAIGDPQWVV